MTFPTHITYPDPADKTEIQAASLLARLGKAQLQPSAQSTDTTGTFKVALAARNWVEVPDAAAHAGWIWLRLTADGSGELIASQGSYLFTGVHLLEQGLGPDQSGKLADGLLLPATFDIHRPLHDACLTQYWRSARGFDDEAYVRALAEAGFTHCEVNALQAHFPYEESIQAEFYPQFYNYCAGFNHFIDTELTRGLWPAHYLEANLNRLKHIAALAKRYGLKPGVLMFEPRSLPEKFFTKYPTLRGARIDHPFRSRLPRYCLAQDHPVTKRHYAECMENLMTEVPELDYLSIWSNDSGAGFEHTGSLYVGRNGGPYMIREWRDHAAIAEVAGKSVVDYMANLQQAAAKTNPDFKVSLRLEPFKGEHEHIVNGLGGNLTWEGPSMLVKGYELPYPHPKYPENFGVAGTIFHSWMDETEAPALAKSKAAGTNPILSYAATGLYNHEPLIGLPFPRMLHAKLKALADTGVDRASCMGGLAHNSATPYWPHPTVIRAAQFTPDRPVDEVLREYATSLVGAEHAAELDQAWQDIEEALVWQPLVGLYCAFGFCWQRTWDRPFVPDIEAVPAEDRRYYEKHGCFQHNNPSINDLGRDVLFDLITREQGQKMSSDMDTALLPRLRKTIATLDAKLESLHAAGQSDCNGACKVFRDLRDRARGYLHWVIALRNVCSWCAEVYGYLESDDDAERNACVQRLQQSIDLDLENTEGLLDLIENSSTEIMVVSAVGNHTYLYGEDLPDLLRRRLELTRKYRDHAPRIDRNILWRPVAGTAWPKGWAD
ncbi:hypothetical protein [Actomonas aquatica]|uniref:Glycoside hydrolase family 42 N-terminal domain-containing protein n=1 Tax=Actomonas aquatica TaxID=2866162 RepID=A0ABZ1CDR5_9BACT|nr:hypothetical protein [Opitutus sp. WL0086]WRQ89566.1 hypothetical protein K1X11_009110 [Opitutus sp. WL0086]